MARKIASLTERLLKCEAEFVEAATDKLLFLYLKHLTLILFVLGVSLILIYIRLAIFTAIPLINENIVPIVIGLDFVMIDFQLQSTLLKLGWDVIAGVVDTFGGHLQPLKGPYNFYPKRLLSPKQAKSALNDFASTCISYDSVDIIFAKIARTLIGPALCPVLRYLYPVKPLYDAAMWAFGWASADPTPLGYAGENNCKDSPEDLSWVCAAIGVGYVMLEVIFPLLILFIALEALLVPTARFAVVLIEEAIYLAEKVFKGIRDVESGAASLEKSIIAREERRLSK
tara:strand:+ start:134 stop:988 length:855 start_codon:yes stop_codon:yes gene_type:complete